MRLGARHTEVVGDGLIEPIVTPLGFRTSWKSLPSRASRSTICLFRWKILL